MCYGYCNMYGYGGGMGMDLACAYYAMNSLLNGIRSLKNNNSGNNSSYSTNPFGNYGTNGGLVGDLLTNPTGGNGANHYSVGGTNPFDNYYSPVNQQKMALIDSIYGADPTSIFRDPSIVGAGAAGLVGNGLFPSVSNLDISTLSGVMTPASDYPSMAGITSLPGLSDLIGPQYNNHFQPTIVQASDNENPDNNAQVQVNSNNQAQVNSNYQAHANQRVRVDNQSTRDVVINPRTGVVTLSQQVVDKINEIASVVKCNPQDLMGVIYMESGFKTVPDNWNGKHAVGLIQWTDIALKDLRIHKNLNYTKQDIANMSVMEQLELAKITLLREKEVAGFDNNHFLTAAELYAMNYVPAGAKNPNCVAKRGDGNYEGNEGLDTNKDGYITHSELNSRVQRGCRQIVQV